MTPMAPGPKEDKPPEGNPAKSGGEPTFTFPAAVVPEGDMSAVRDVLSHSPGATDETQEAAERVITVEQIEMLLRASYAAGYLHYGYEDVWTPRAEEVRRVAEALLPRIQAFIVLVPAAAGAIRMADTASPWVQLLWYWLRPTWQSERRKAQERRAAQEEENAHGTGQPERPIVARPSQPERGAQAERNRFIVP